MQTEHNYLLACADTHKTFNMEEEHIYDGVAKMKVVLQNAIKKI